MVGMGGFGRKEQRGCGVGGRDVGGKEAGLARIGLSKLGVRSGGTNARWGDGAGGDGDLLVPTAPCLIAWHGICSGKHCSTPGKINEAPSAVAQGMRVCPPTPIIGRRDPAPSAEQGCIPVACVGV